MNIHSQGFGGGPMVPEVGDHLWASGVNIVAMYGSTELGGVCHSPFNMQKGESSTSVNGKPSRPWSYLQFDDKTARKWIPQGDDTFELVLMVSCIKSLVLFLKVEKQKCPTHIPARLNYEDGEGYRTADLFVPHPTTDDAWVFVGRRDDLILHSTGEKSVPGPLENIIGKVQFGCVALTNIIIRI
jgi:acyl-coenzyme A synthetase/AMP-(fatty) acid ligase